MNMSFGTVSIPTSDCDTVFVPSPTENIMPKEVEDTISSCKAVKECAVVGVPSQLWGEEVFAWVVLREGYTEGPSSVSLLREHCASRMAGFKIPTYLAS